MSSFRKTTTLYSLHTFIHIEILFRSDFKTIVICVAPLILQVILSYMYYS